MERTAIWQRFTYRVLRMRRNIPSANWRLICEWHYTKLCAFVACIWQYVDRWPAVPASLSMVHSNSLKSLDELRSLVRDYLEKARDGVMSYHREEDNAFWRDSKQKREGDKPDKPNPIITSRCYLALFYSELALANPGEALEPKWLQWFRGYMEQQPFSIAEDGTISDSKSDTKLNYFELSHLPDLILCKELCNRFWSGYGAVASNIVKSPNKENKQPFNEKQIISDRILNILRNPPGNGSQPENSSSTRKFYRGEVQLAEEEKDSSHYFVTLHLLRGIAISGEDSDARADSEIERIRKGVREFCIEQAFFGQRGIRHKQDAFRLAFAGTIYCLYEKHAERDLICAFVEALEKCQQENGMWPASHPIFREKKEPWHIASHEVALCLTWLYFQPNLPDEARVRLLSMMECYFRDWVVATYAAPQSDPYHGWYDDHSIGEGSVVGWATAIVCHFLAGYYWVLCDWINRRVIEELGIERHASGYMIWEGAPASRTSVMWRRRKNYTIWPDLPPFRWQLDEVTKLQKNAAINIRSNWKDPGTSDGDDALISDRIASRILVPLYRNPGSRPNRYQCSMLLPGKPGTGKSTFVSQVAKVLKWPRVSVPAYVIFDKGFDYLETRANEVFSLLNMLTSSVIFFDEFEEFLRKRPDDKGNNSNTGTSSHTRTIAAFTTSSMLTRMQELHDQAYCLIFLATNHEKQIDDAAKRPGRIDHRLEIRHPTEKRVSAFLKEPEQRMLLNLDIPEDEKVWKKLITAVENALGVQATKKLLNAETDLRDSGTIPFHYIKYALNSEMSKSGDLKKSILKLLTDESSDPPNYPPNL